MERYLLIRPGAIGDAIVTLPVVQALKARFPEAYVELVVGGEAVALLRGRCAADAISSYDDPCWAALFAEEIPPTMRAFLRGFKAVILYLASSAETFARRLAPSGRPQITHCPPSPETPMPISLHLQGALASLGIFPRSEAPRLTLTTNDRAFAEEFWQAHHLLDEQPVVALHPGSGSAKKNWSAARYAELAARLRQEQGARLLIVAGPADMVAVQAISASWLGEPLLTTEGLSLPKVGSLLARCGCLVGNDSGIAHLAAALGVPTVAIFGPTDPRVWAPQGSAVTVVTPQVDCAPCTAKQRRHCPDLRCLENISVETVSAAVLRYLF